MWWGSSAAGKGQCSEPGGGVVVCAAGGGHAHKGGQQAAQVEWSSPPHKQSWHVPLAPCKPNPVCVGEYIRLRSDIFQDLKDRRLKIYLRHAKRARKATTPLHTHWIREHSTYLIILTIDYKNE